MTKLLGRSVQFNLVTFFFGSDCEFIYECTEPNCVGCGCPTFSDPRNVPAEVLRHLRAHAQTHSSDFRKPVFYSVPTRLEHYEKVLDHLRAIETIDSQNTMKEVIQACRARVLRQIAEIQRSSESSGS